MCMNEFEERSFWERVHDLCTEDLLYSSRIHPLSSFSTPQATVYIKREDESAFGISGYKKRKFASLIPHLITGEFEEILLIGGSHSNHIVAAVQLLKEHNLPYKLFLKKSHSAENNGNKFLLSLLTQAEDICWVDSQDWHKVEKIAYQSIGSSKSMLIPEGGFCSPAIPGLCTLWEDIMLNQKSSQLNFDHIVMDAGTGLSAAVVEAVLSLYPSPPQFHIILMADSETDYLQKYRQVTRWFEQIFGNSPKASSAKLYRPFTARAFGSVNAQVRKFCQYMAHEEGVLCDPIYAAKMFLQAKHMIEEGLLSGSTLLVHSGGGTGLMGFSEKWNLPFT